MSRTGFLSSEQAKCPQSLLAAAQAKPSRTLLVVRGSSSLPVQSAYDGLKAGISTPLFVGEPELIKQQGEAIGWHIDDDMIIASAGEEEAASISAQLIKDDLPAHGGEGRIGAVMKGQLHTDVFMGALLDKSVGLRTGERLVHTFVIYDHSGTRPVMVSDAAVNVTPDEKTQMQSLRQMVRIGHILGIERPKIATLSATETPIASVPSSVLAAERAAWARDNIDNADFEGPLSFDLAMSEASVKIKGLAGSVVAGQADGLLVPDLVSGNILYKALVYIGGGCAAGVVTGGSLPILLTSRADPPAARLASIALASLV